METVTLTFDSMAHGGEGVARDPAGRVVFVPHVIAGETARVEIVETRRGFARGRMVELLDASPFRVPPSCPHFPPTSRGGEVTSGCGGCQWQHIAYEQQLEFKTRIVREQFARIGKIRHALIAPTLAAPDPWHYRNNMQFVVNQAGQLCLNAQDSHRFIPIRECWIMDAPLTEMFRTLELAPECFDGVTLRAGERTGDRMLILESDDPSIPEIETDEPASMAFRSGDATVPLLGHEALSERIGARTFRISPDSFFQVNTRMAEMLLELVTAALEPSMDDVLLDAYSGVGLFGLSLAPRVKRVIEIEASRSAIADAHHNGRALENVEFHQGQVERVLPRLNTPIHVAIVDPPRAGLEPAALDALTGKKPRTLVYVSCDPATLARDVARFEKQGYQLASVQPLDMFPQTFHIECVAKLTLN